LTREEMKEHGIKRVFMSNPDQIIGKTVAVDLKRGSTFDTKDFYAPGTGPGIADKLQPGQRAVTIEVNATNALLGFAGAGQNVDVLFHFGQNSRSSSPYGDNNLDFNQSDAWRPPHFDYSAQRADDYSNNYDNQNRRRSGFGQKYQSATVTLVQKATILALGQRVNQTGNSSRLGPEERVRVTLAVKPDSAELIRVAEGHGELSLTLRGFGDEEIVDTTGPTVLGNIIKMDDPILVAKRNVRDLDVYRGQHRSRVRFTRDRDTGKDDFQRWIMVEPAPADAPENGGDKVETNQPAGNAISSGSGSRTVRPVERQNDRYSGNRQANSPFVHMTEDRAWAARNRLESDFRKIRTLFNQAPERRDPSSNNRPANVNQQVPNDSDDLSSSSTDIEIRSAKAVELYDPRSWK